jgi:hypothetical protein
MVRLLASRLLTNEACNSFGLLLDRGGCAIVSTNRGALYGKTCRGLLSVGRRAAWRPALAETCIRSTISQSESIAFLGDRPESEGMTIFDQYRCCLAARPFLVHGPKPPLAQASARRRHLVWNTDQSSRLFLSVVSDTIATHRDQIRTAVWIQVLPLPSGRNPADRTCGERRVAVKHPSSRPHRSVV